MLYNKYIVIPFMHNKVVCIKNSKIILQLSSADLQLCSSPTPQFFLLSFFTYRDEEIAQPVHFL